MEHLNNLVSLAQQIESIMDDTNSDVISLSMASDGARYLVSHDYFLGHFDKFKITRIADSKFPVKLSTEVKGITFVVNLRFDEVKKLEGYVSDEWLETFKPQVEESFSVKMDGNVHKKSLQALECE